MTEISADSAGQAAEKYNAYLESIEAKTAALSTALKDLYNGIIPRSFIGDLTDAATGIIKFVDEYEVLKNLLKSALFYGLAKGVIAAKNSFVGMVQSVKNVSTAMNLANNSTAMTADRMTQLQSMTKVLTDKQLQLILSNSKLTESEKIKMLMVDGVTEAEAREKLATLGIISTNNAAQVSTLSLSGAFKTLWAVIAANPIGALTMVISAVTMGISTYKQKVEEAREADKQAADQAKETADSISDLKEAYTKAKEAYEDGTGSKDNLTAATDTLLTALGYEKDAVADLIAEYGDLDTAMSKVTAQKLREQLPDLAKGVKTELSELKDEAMGHDQGAHLGFDITADNTDRKVLMDLINDYAKTQGGIITQAVNSMTTRIDFEGSRGTAEGIKERIENMKGLQQALFDYYGADKVNDIPFYNQLSKRITALTAEYEDYDKALDTYNDTAAKVAVSEYALSHELPKTADEYAEYRKEIIEAARASGDFLGTDAEMVEAIDGVLDGMDGLSDIQRRMKNIDIAKAMFGLDNIKSAADGAKMAFINALSDEDLDILVNKIEDPFAEGIEGAKRKIAEFKGSSDNEISVEVDTASFEDIYKELDKSAGAIINNSKTVSTALKEIEEHGQLSASSIQAMTAAGYSQALSVNEVTGAITINKSALDKLIEAEKTELKLAIAKASVDLITPYKEQTTSIADLQRELATANEERREEIRLEIARQQAALATAQALDGETEARKKQLADLKALLDSIDAPTFESGSGSGSGSTASKTDENKAAFDAEYAEYKHSLEMGRISESEYLGWLDGAYKKHFSDRTKYAAEWNKYEEEVFKGRKSIQKSAFEDEIDSYTGNADRAINKGVDSDGKALNSGKYDYARAEITKAMTATQSRIDELKASGLKNNDDEIKKLTDDLDRYADKLIDITDKERKAEQDYIKGIRNDYSDMMDDRIDAIKDYADTLKDAYDAEIDALDDEIKAIDKKQKAQKAENDLLDAQNDLIEA